MPISRTNIFLVKPFLIASATRCLMAQRLVRKVCPKCEAPVEPIHSELSALGLDINNLKDPNFKAGKGCATCNNTGYKGRFGCFEVYVMEEEGPIMIFKKVTNV